MPEIKPMAFLAPFTYLVNLAYISIVNQLNPGVMEKNISSEITVNGVPVSYVTTFGDGRLADVYIPAYDIHFSAPKDDDLIRNRATNAVKSFYGLASLLHNAKSAS